MARRIDHLVVGVHDLDAAGAFYETLGFLVGTRNRHPWGTENRIVQFGASFLELITVGDDAAAIPPHRPRHFSFGAFVRDALAVREGISMLVLDSADAKADAEGFRTAGIGDFEPFFFERRGRRPDGSEVEVAFTLAFARDDAAPQIGFFTCRQHHPENFWNPDVQRHPNGAGDIRSVTLDAPRPQAHRAFLAAFANTEADGEETAPVPLRDGLVALRRTDAGPARLSGFSLPVSDLGAQASRLRAAGIPFDSRAAGLVVPPAAARGVEIRFEGA